MSKSNIEKYRLQKIKQFESNNVDIDSCIFKVKIKFKYMINKNNKSVEKRTLNIDKKISFQYKQFFSALIYNNLKDLKIYDFNVHLNIEHSITEENNIIKIKVFIYHKKTLICEIEPFDFISNFTPRYLSYLQESKMRNIFEVENKINIYNFLNIYILECYEIYTKPHFFQDFQISNSEKYVSFLHVRCKNSKIPKILNKSYMYQQVKKIMTFMHLNKKELNINGFSIRYDFTNKGYNSLSVKVPTKKEDPVEWFSVNETTIFDNLRVFQCLKKNNFINFDIDDLSEDEIIEMFSILNY